jgi:DnaJ-class molecular chaperone
MIFSQIQCYKCKGKGFRYVKDYFDPTEVVPEDCELCSATGVLSPETCDSDEKIARLAAADMCLRCETFLDGASVCPVCKLQYGVHHYESK